MGEPETISGLEGVFLESRDRLLRFLRARGAGDDAEDVLHDLWERVRGGPGGPVAEPLSYLFRAAENLMRDRHRAASSRSRRESAWHEASEPGAAPPGGDQVLLARERLREVQAALAAQGPRVELVFRRFRLDGVGQAQIARELNVSLSTVEKDLQRAYRALAELKERRDAE